MLPLRGKGAVSVFRCQSPAGDPPIPADPMTGPETA
jgi:hypothetical protein